MHVPDWLVGWLVGVLKVPQFACATTPRTTFCPLPSLELRLLSFLSVRQTHSFFCFLAPPPPPVVAWVRGRMVEPRVTGAGEGFGAGWGGGTMLVDLVF